MDPRNHVTYPELRKKVQVFLSEKHPDALKSSQHYELIKPYIAHYIRTNALYIEGMETDEIVDRLYSDMVEYSFLTAYMKRPDVDEININAWNDVAVSYSNGITEKIRSFDTPDHALDTVRKMLAYSHTVLDDAIPFAEGELPNNGRITAMKFPLVDADTYVSASIRLLHPSRITVENIVSFGSATKEMIRFLSCCMRYGVSFVVAGATFSGKTTLLNALLKTMPNEKRIFTIEAGSRELDLVRKDEGSGAIVNNVIQALSKKSDKPAENITMEKLVVASLRYNPELIVVGEMRDEEAYAAIDASLTGHTLVSTIHSFAGEEAHMRLATLCQKRFPMDLSISLMQAAKAFPVICFEQKLDDGSRKITNITECEVDNMGHRVYHTLFRYVVDRNEIVDGKLVVKGHYETVERMSDSLCERMQIFGIPDSLLEQLTKQ